MQRPRDKLNSTERDLLHEAAGQLNWLATQSRPDISHDVLQLTMSIKHAIVDNLKQANKVVKRVKGENIEIRFPYLSPPKDFCLAAFSDASYANLVDGVSNGEGFIIYLLEMLSSCMVF